MFDAFTRPAPRRRLRSLFLVASLALHASGVVALLVMAMWKIEKLAPDRTTVAIGPKWPEPQGGGDEPKAPPPPTRPKQRHKTRPPVVTQPTDKPPVEDVATATDTGGTPGDGPVGPGAGDGPPGDQACVGDDCAATGEPQAPPPAVCGNGTVEAAADEQCDDGNTAAGDGCSPKCRTEAKIVQSQVVRALRWAGDDQIQPPATVKTQMMRDGKQRTSAVIKLCLDSAGQVSSLQLLASSGYEEYDRRLLAGMREWRYRPYTVGNQALPVCSPIAFVYVMR